jgi:hypothetical protein
MPEIEARGADLEIFEKRSRENTLNVLRPNRMRINGAEVLIPADTKVTIDMNPLGKSHVTATITMMVGKLSMHYEAGDDASS